MVHAVSATCVLHGLQRYRWAARGLATNGSLTDITYSKLKSMNFGIFKMKHCFRAKFKFKFELTLTRGLCGHSVLVYSPVYKLGHFM